MKNGGRTLKYVARERWRGKPMADEYAVSTRRRDATTPDILSKRGGIFWGAVLMLIGGLWFGQVMGIIDLGEKFVDAILPLMLIIGGLYLLVMKVGR